MKVDIIGLLSETSMHPGTESSTGIVDLPISRESYTGYPTIAGSSMKGAFRDNFEYLIEDKNERIADEVFGKQNRAGDISFSDARILLLPIRSLTGHYKWVTCPYILDRFSRDLKIGGHRINDFEIPNIDEGEALGICDNDDLFLEEIVFKVKEDRDLLNEISSKVTPLLYHESLKSRLIDQLVIVNDSEFSYFSNYCLEVRARNKLDSTTKTSDNLWYEECIPPDTLFYTLLLCRAGKEGSLKKLKKTFSNRPYMQIGGNETIGQGWSVLSWWEEGGTK